MKRKIMYFFCGGYTSKEEMFVVDETEDKIYLCDDENGGITYNEDGEEEMYMDVWCFDKKTGKCLNDNNFMGCYRYIGLD